ncbi:MAG: LysM domain-containing protein [Proteobacteria bacterium]|nr:MAG: LysM domain-containing protein [Pseudomonadota bacterium]
MTNLNEKLTDRRADTVGHHLLSELALYGRKKAKQGCLKRFTRTTLCTRKWHTRLVPDLFATALLLIMPTVSLAQSAIPRLSENAPDTYVVESGDTLWDISALFLNEPWRWPELWRVNPDVRDPNLIYPGDTLYLRWEDGKPGVYLTAGTFSGGASDVVRLSPTVRVEPLAAAIDALPREAIDPFIARHRFVTQFDLEAMPRIISGYDGRLISGMGDRVYAVGTFASEDQQFDVVRPAREIRHPETGEMLGTLLSSVGRVVLSQRGSADDEASQFDVLASREELRVGDVLLPVEDRELVAKFVPQVPTVNLDSGFMLSLENGATQIGALDVVATTFGEADDVEVGTLLSIEKVSAPVTDQVSGQRYTLPAETAGTMMLFAVYDRASFGLVLNANQPLSVSDRLVNP